MTALAGRRILLGVSGGIAAYKSAELVRLLRAAGADVRVVMTAGAQAFIGPLTLQALSGHRVRTELLDQDAEAGMGHIELARWADQVLIAPATAQLIARLAAGFADDLLTTLVLATEAPIFIAPAMNQQMWASPQVGDNVARLQSLGMTMLGPGIGDQACGETGPGRLLEPVELVASLAATSLSSSNRLHGRRFVVTAGPTHEALDPVRFLGNRSSGRMGFALASALAVEGAAVDLVAGPVHLPTPAGVRRHSVQTAGEMLETVMPLVIDADGFIGVAAVADYRPESPAEHKIKKSGEALTLRLVPNPDILATVAACQDRPRLVMGFAAETRDLETAARGKLERKRLDLIAANQVGDGLAFDQSDNALLVLGRHQQWQLPQQDKSTLAKALVDIIVDELATRDA
ncbi:MAG: bifunctional phosphopantothenoylcysteine decarboxylase/phosphopantothenate--cysteine ligase CoaBC [Wenzhouxiangella sp.]